jgi:hypothetical protein
MSFLLIGLLALVGCSSSQRAQTKVQRQPLEKQRREYKTPTNYELRDRGYDPKTGKMITYDHKPHVDLLDEKAGKYAFKWIGYDGKEKTAIFQRGDAIDVIVIASASKTSDGRYLYRYQAQNLRSSGTSLAGLALQNFASDVKPTSPGGYAGEMSSLISQFKEGHWIRFGNSFFGKVFEPGEQLNVELASSSPPGLVECRVHGGESNLEGAGEEMPAALENLLPGYAEWPKGYTIGPVENMKTFSSEQKIKYLLERLPQFRKLGWMTDEAVVRYEQQLRRSDLESLSSQLNHDLKSEQITTEVLAIIQAMN